MVNIREVSDYLRSPADYLDSSTTEVLASLSTFGLRIDRSAVVVSQ